MARAEHDPRISTPVAGYRPAQQERSVDTEERILDELASALRTNPARSVGLHDLLAAADAGPGSFYARFDNLGVAVEVLAHRQLEDERRADAALFDAERWRGRELADAWRGIGDELWRRRTEDHLPLAAAVRQAAASPDLAAARADVARQRTRMAGLLFLLLAGEEAPPRLFECTCEAVHLLDIQLDQLTLLADALAGSDVAGADANARLVAQVHRGLVATLAETFGAVRHGRPARPPVLPDPFAIHERRPAPRSLRASEAHADFQAAAASVLLDTPLPQITVRAICDVALRTPAAFGRAFASPTEAITSLVDEQGLYEVTLPRLDDADAPELVISRIVSGLTAWNRLRTRLHRAVLLAAFDEAELAVRLFRARSEAIDTAAPPLAAATGLPLQTAGVLLAALFTAMDHALLFGPPTASTGGPRALASLLLQVVESHAATAP